MALTSNQARFAEAYQEALITAIEQHPDEYAYPVSEAQIVVSRMLAAIERNSFSTSGRAFPAACKALGIRYTRKAILAFWNEPDSPRFDASAGSIDNND